MEISRILSPQPNDEPKASKVTIKEDPEKEKRIAERQAEKEKRRENAKKHAQTLAPMIGKKPPRLQKRPTHSCEHCVGASTNKSQAQTTHFAGTAQTYPSAGTAQTTHSAGTTQTTHSAATAQKRAEPGPEAQLMAELEPEAQKRAEPQPEAQVTRTSSEIAAQAETFTKALQASSYTLK